MKNFIPLGFAVVVGVALSGCGERRVAVEGEVTLDGQPVARATQHPAATR